MGVTGRIAPELERLELIMRHLVGMAGEAVQVRAHLAGRVLTELGQIPHTRAGEAIWLRLCEPVARQVPAAARQESGSSETASGMSGTVLGGAYPYPYTPLYPHALPYFSTTLYRLMSGIRAGRAGRCRTGVFLCRTGAGRCWTGDLLWLASLSHTGPAN